MLSKNTKAKKVQKAPKVQKAQLSKRKLSTTKKSKLSTPTTKSNVTTTGLNFAMPSLSTLTSISTPKSLLMSRRQFSTKNGDQDQQQQDQNDSQQQDSQQQQQQGNDDDETDPIQMLQNKVTKYKQRVKELERAQADNKLIIEEWQNKARQLQDRVKAEIEEQHNIHDRYKREIADVKKYSVGKFSKQILEGIDALEAAQAATTQALEKNKDNEALQQLAEGLEMTTAVFHKTLAKEGIQKFTSLGLVVDPNLHFITAQFPSDQPAGTVTHILKEGYHIHDRVLRPAQVIVAQEKAAV